MADNAAVKTISFFLGLTATRRGQQNLTTVLLEAFLPSGLGWQKKRMVPTDGPVGDPACSNSAQYPHPIWCFPAVSGLCRSVQVCG